MNQTERAQLSVEGAKARFEQRRLARITDEFIKAMESCEWGEALSESQRQPGMTDSDWREYYAAREARRRRY